MALPFEQTPEQIAAAKRDAELARVANQGKPGYDVFGEPVAGTPLAGGGASTTTPTETPTQLRYTDTSSQFAPGGIYANRTAPTPADEATIRENDRKRVQVSIDAINEAANRELAAVQARQTQSLGRARALASATGTLGSPMENQPIADIEVRAADERRLIEKQRAADIQAINTNVEDRSNALIEKQKTEAKTNVEAYNTFLKTTAEQAVKDMTSLATAQADLSYSQKQKLMQQSGYDEKTFDDLYKGMKDEAAVLSAQKANATVGDPIKSGTKLIYTVKDPKSPNGLKTVVIETGVNVEDSKYSIISDTNGIWTLDTHTGKATRVGAPVVGSLEAESKRLQAESLKLDIQKKQQELGGGTTSGGKALDQINLVKSSLERAKELANASGRSGIRKATESWIIGSTDYTNLVAETNTLRTNVLTMMTDPSIKKFFGPQMSNTDVQLMTSAGTTLNPELQSSDKMKEELVRLKDLVDRAENAVKKGTAGGQSEEDKLRALGYSEEQINTIKSAQ